MNAPVRLDDRTILALSGADTHSFLQGLITNDIRKLGPETSLYAALLTPQGKILFDFLLFEGPEAVWLDCASAGADALQKRLSLYRLRARVDIARRDDMTVLADLGGSDMSGRNDPRLAALGRRAVVPRDTVCHGCLSGTAYVQHRLMLGVPEAADFGQDKMFALDADLAELHGVAFDKGCYVGQELTARMKHRGTARKRLLPVQTANGDALPAPETPLTVDGRDIGSLTSIYGARGFALVRLDRLDEAGEASLEAGGVAVNISKPSWLFP